MRFYFVVSALLTLSACGVENGNFATTNTESKAPTGAATKAEDIQILAAQPTKSFSKIGPVEVTLNKLTALHPNPTPEATLQALKKEAAKIGADAILDVEVSDIKIQPLSWGARTATGIAIKF